MRRPVLAIGLLLAMLVAGCGGEQARGDRAPTASTMQDSSLRFVAAADAICARANKAEAALGAVGVDFVYHEQFDDPEFLAKFTPIGAAALAELKALKTPPGKQKQAAATLNAIERMIDTLEQRTADLEAGTDKRRADQVNDYLTGYNDLAVAAGPLGWSECQGLVL